MNSIKAVISRSSNSSSGITLDKVPEVSQEEHTCLGDEEPDTCVDVPSRPCNDTPVHTLITLSEWMYSNSDDSCLSIISNGASVTKSFLGCFHHYVTQIIYRSFAPVLCVSSELTVILTRDCDRSSRCCGYLLWTWQLNWVCCILC